MSSKGLKQEKYLTIKTKTFALCPSTEAKFFFFLGGWGVGGYVDCIEVDECLLVVPWTRARLL